MPPAGSHVPRVTIGMPAYNDERFIRTALDSLLAQSFTDFELIVSDNASTDRTPAICREYAERDSRVRYLRHATNIGVIANFNSLLQRATGAYFMWAATDDRWDPDFLVTVVAATDASPGCSGAFTPYRSTDEAGVPLGPVRRCGYTSRAAVLRIVQFAAEYDDGCIYALWDTARIRAARLPQWWSINRNSAVNCAYPPLFGLVAAGELVLAGDRPMWFNRGKATSIGMPVVRGGVARLATQVVHKMNVCTESVLYIFRGSGSLAVTVAAVPALGVRFVVEVWHYLRVAMTQRVGAMRARRA